MAAGVVTVGSHRYAVGLYWENSPGGGRVTQIAREAANQTGQQADYYAIHAGNKTGRIPQFGLCSAEAGQSAGMPVLAACLANQIPGSWAGAFRLSEGIAVVIVRDDLIVPDGDLFYLDETEARDRLLQEIGFGGLQTIYAPESWSIPISDTIPLTLLVGNNQSVKLQRVSLSKTQKVALIAAAAIVVLALGGFWFWQSRIDAENAEQARLNALAAEAARRAGISQSNKTSEPVYERKWETAPAALAVVDACHNALAKINAVQAGWRLTSLKCTSAGVSLSWSRASGFSTPPKGWNISDTATAATQFVPITGLTPRGTEVLEDSEVTTARYLAQNWPGGIAHINDDPPPPPPPNYKGKWNPTPPPWIKRSFTLTVSELPAGLPDYLGGMPGVVINDLSYTPSGAAGSWTVQGVIYENRR